MSNGILHRMLGVPELIAAKIGSYGSGLFGPVDDERNVTDLPVIEGEIPTELFGMFARNSPNPRFAPRGRYHWFDGDGMVHAVYIEGGKARYQNRFVQTRGLALEQAAGHALWSGILEPIDIKNPHGPIKNTANTDLVFHGGKLLALWWLGAEPYALNGRDLSTEGVWDFHGTAKAGCASHAKLDTQTGDLMFFDYSAIRPPYMTYGVANKDGRVDHHTAIDLPGPRLLHDLAITPNYTVLLDLPLLWRNDKLQAGKRYVAFDKSIPARFGILPRRGHGSQVRWLEDDACYIFHTVNAYENGNELVLEACRIADPMAKLREPPSDSPRLDFMDLTPYLTRWRFDLTTGSAKREQLDDVPTEFPAIDVRRRGRNARYAYSPRLARTPTLLFEGFIKYDLLRGTSIYKGFGEGQFGCEGAFVPRPGATDEDDGWVVTFTLDGFTDTSNLLVLNARDLSTAARISLPRRVPIGFHSTWVPGELLGTGIA
ncbi:MAG: carotenoid oxygenase family protein [Polyangiaceae bacterium]|nr:carotenoid oxygenase family protein [Polyangiaceae bacterium]